MTRCYPQRGVFSRVSKFEHLMPVKRYSSSILSDSFVEFKYINMYIYFIDVLGSYLESSRRSMTRIVKREPETSRSSREPETGESTRQAATERRVLRSRYLAVKNLINGAGF